MIEYSPAACGWGLGRMIVEKRKTLLLAGAVARGSAATGERGRRQGSERQFKSWRQLLSAFPVLLNEREITPAGTHSTGGEMVGPAATEDLFHLRVV